MFLVTTSYQIAASKTASSYLVHPLAKSGNQNQVHSFSLGIMFAIPNSLQCTLRASLRTNITRKSIIPVLMRIGLLTHHGCPRVARFSPMLSVRIHYRGGVLLQERILRLLWLFLSRSASTALYACVSCLNRSRGFHGLFPCLVSYHPHTVRFSLSLNARYQYVIRPKTN